ncbi:uncharacterized protein LOC122639805 isoform X2 [Telopea speciosissima]|uniref:uncharacterized protein LOC122639805 isoform X2 n=1 Tax=Telopea speciosissima TaxID=54955 RepID=UPI001CC7AF9E|nr:uncharacterized protein LOC122639805 isoform X2 [Telopea speciosissima]
MVLRKPKANLSLVNGGRFHNRKCVTNGVGSRRKISESIDHWAFLEEIEAPMWVDLTLETKSMDQDMHDAWFQVAHPFHQCSSNELMSASSLSGEGNRNSNSELLGSYSPTLPSSVSKSRGKDNRSRKWDEGNHVSLNKPQHIGSLGQRMSWMVRGSVQEMKPEHKFGNKKDTDTKKESLICLRSSTASMRSYSSKTMSTFGDTKSSSLVKSSVIGESNSTSTTGNSKSFSNFKGSTLTVNNQQQLQDTSEILHRTSGLTTGFFLAKRIRLTRTRVLRQPSRVEIKHSNGNKSSSSKPSGFPTLNPGKQSNGRKSSSSKSSSVGSSMNPRFDLKDTTLSAVVNIYTTPESRKVISFGQAAKHPKQKASDVSKTSGIQDPDFASSSQLGGKALIGKFTNQSSRVLCQIEPTYALQLGKVQESSNVYMKDEEMVGTTRSNRVAGSRNVNVRGSMVLGQISSGKENAAGGIPGQKPMKQTVKVKNVVGLSDIKLGKVQESSNVYTKAEEMVGTRRSNRVAGSRNVNARGSMVLSQISSGKENAAGGIPGQKPAQQTVKVKNVMGLSDIKQKTKRGNQSNKPVDAAQRIYFR